MLYARVGRRPWLGPVVVDAATAKRFASAADALLTGAAVDVPEPRLDFLRWVATNRDVVFHGSNRSDLTELSTARQSRDSTVWGDQQAVYATTDPVWAIYFGTLRRDNGFEHTFNGTIGVAGGPLYPRTYFFVHNRGSESRDRFGPGSVYVLPPGTFVSQRLDAASTPRISSRTSRSSHSPASASGRRTSPSATGSALRATASRCS